MVWSSDLTVSETFSVRKKQKIILSDTAAALPKKLSLIHTSCGTRDSSVRIIIANRLADDNW